MREKGEGYKKYTVEFKTMVVERIIEEKMSCRQAAKLFDIGFGSNSTSCMIMGWVRRYLEKGADGLMKKSGGGTPKPDRPKPIRKPKKKEFDGTDLLAENQYLRAENEYLKKLHALALSKSEKETKPE